MGGRLFLKRIESLARSLFEKRWMPLDQAFSGSSLKMPGIYALAYSDQMLSGRRVSMKDIFYIGMSNSAGGVKQRLKQFRAGIESGTGHSGGNRFFRDYSHSAPFSKVQSGKKFYVVTVMLECSTQKLSRNSEDLRQMGHIACMEYYALALVRDQMGMEPKLNKR